ncbi:hypothetical protein ILUMI_19598 [Ignelater luminosus]|uniref:Uncharacterized protein n=1 Tax=Ignelater luminosus TaxID=2038154 RepID=A0A8K0G5C0_IGNLU|nr:hypothetical protein ILUMI_19598 [Ignelater luminosus]
MPSLTTRSFFVFLLIKCVLLRQYNYKIQHNAIKIDYYNPTYIENPIVNLFYYNQTRQCVNGSVTVLHDVGEKVRGYYEVYNLYIDDADLPPYGVPFGKYKAVGTFYELDTPNGTIVSGEYLADVVPLKGHH